MMIPPKRKNNKLIVKNVHTRSERRSEQAPVRTLNELYGLSLYMSQTRGCYFIWLCSVLPSIKRKMWIDRFSPYISKSHWRHDRRISFIAFAARTMVYRGRVSSGHSRRRSVEKRHLSFARDKTAKILILWLCGFVDNKLQVGKSNAEWKTEFYIPNWIEQTTADGSFVLNWSN